MITSSSKFNTFPIKTTLRCVLLKVRLSMIIKRKVFMYIRSSICIRLHNHLITHFSECALIKIKIISAILRSISIKNDISPTGTIHSQTIIQIVFNTIIINTIYKKKITFIIFNSILINQIFAQLNIIRNFI